MSANNWAHCPRCTERAETSLGKRATEIEKAYGKVSVREFDEMREKLEMDRKSLAHAEPTFREDWSVTGAAEGVVHVYYSGSCSVCRLKLEFDTDHLLYPEAG